MPLLILTMWVGRSGITIITASLILKISWYFADNWLNPAFDIYMLEFIDFARLAEEWHQCFNRTDGGCAGF